MNTEQHSFLAIDLGATSGRTVLGTLAGGRIVMEELTRFANHITQMRGHSYWNLHALYAEIVCSLCEVARRGLTLTSIGIDTWGVDIVCVGCDGQPLREPLSYRDPFTFAAMDDYLANVMSRDDVYHRTGIQFLNFNTLFQLHAMRSGCDVALANAAKILFIPDAISWLLTGEMVCERTIASTSQILDPRTGELDNELLASVGLTRSHFGHMVSPGTRIGTLSAEIQRLTGLGAVPVVAVAGHDTASAVAAVPAQNERFAYLSSGTWSLMGIESQQPIISSESLRLNFTNEGGVCGTTRFLKNICGMWLYERCRAEWPDAADHATLIAEAKRAEPFRSLINPDDPAFANPAVMTRAIADYCWRTGQPVPESRAAMCRCIFESLALRYRQVFEWLKGFTSTPLDVLHVIGGGSRNAFLCQLSANALGLPVIAGPQECTALGNILLQAQAAGATGSLWQMREIVSASVQTARFEPQEPGAWDAAYSRFQNIIK